MESTETIFKGSSRYCLLNPDPDHCHSPKSPSFLYIINTDHYMYIFVDISQVIDINCRNIKRPEQPKKRKITIEEYGFFKYV